METVVINGQPQISSTFGNRMVTYDGLIDFLEMLKDEIPKMGYNNTIAKGAPFSYAIGNNNTLGESDTARSGQGYIFGSTNTIQQNTFKNVYILGSDNESIRPTDGFDSLYSTYILGSSNTNINHTRNTYIFGMYNKAQGKGYTDSLINAYGFGNHLTLTSNATWIGQYNRNHECLENVVFGIGNGESEEVRHNSLIITKDNTLVLNPLAHSYSSSVDNIKNNVFINSKGSSDNNNILKKNITNSILIGQQADGTIGNINKTVIIGQCAKAQGLKHSLLLGDYHRMNLQETYGEDNSFKAFQVFAFGNQLQVPNTGFKSFYADQADYPIFLMGTGIYDRDDNEYDNWTPYAIVVGNKALEKNIFTLDYQGYINAAGINIESMFINGVYVDSSTLTGTADLTHRLDPIAPPNSTSEYDSKYAYWYTADYADSTLYINKYTKTAYLSSKNHPSWYSPKIIAFYTNEKNKPNEKATLQAKNFEADDTVSANTVSVGTLKAKTVDATSLSGVLKTASFVTSFHNTVDGSYCEFGNDYLKCLYYCMIWVNNTTLSYNYYTCLFYLDTQGPIQHSQILHTWDIEGKATISLTWDSTDNRLYLENSSAEYDGQFILIKKLAEMRGDNTD